MNDLRKLPPDQAWDALLRMAARDEAEWVEGLTREERSRELAAMGRDPEAERARGAALAARLLGRRPLMTAVPVEATDVDAHPASGRATLRSAVALRSPSKRSRSRTVVWLLAAALGLLALVLVTERQQLAAWHHPPPVQIGPDPWVPPDPREQAEGLRDEAATACDGTLWGLCATKLDAADTLDPAGATSERAKALRKQIADHTSFNMPDESKGPRKQTGTKPR